MLKDLLYIYYYNQFMKENSKKYKDINWIKWNKYDKFCEKLSK